MAKYKCPKCHKKLDTVEYMSGNRYTVRLIGGVPVSLEFNECDSGVYCPHCSKSLDIEINFDALEGATVYDATEDFDPADIRDGDTVINLFGKNTVDFKISCKIGDPCNFEVKILKSKKSKYNTDGVYIWDGAERLNLDRY